jgi:hypothetical protein
MCGRYYSLFDKQQVAEHFHVRHTTDNVGIIAPNYTLLQVIPNLNTRFRLHTSPNQSFRRRQDEDDPANPAVGNWRNNGPEMLDGH